MQYLRKNSHNGTKLLELGGRNVKMILKNSDLYEIYTDYSEDSFIVGTVEPIQNGFLVIKKLDRIGEYDGLTLINEESITKLNSRTKYLKKYALNSLETVDISKWCSKNVDIIDILKRLSEKEEFVAILTVSNDKIYGVIEKVEQTETHTYINLKEFSEDLSAFDGLCTIELLNIIELSFETKYCKFISNMEY